MYNIIHTCIPNPPTPLLSVGLTGPGPGKFVCMFSVITCTCNGMNSSKMSQWFKILKKKKK